MRHSVSRDLTAHAIEPQICDVMLATAVKAAADLDVKGLVQLRQIHFAYPSDYDVLLNRGANCFSGEAPGNVGQRAQLVRSDIAEREGHGNSYKPSLPLRTRIRLQPFLELMPRAVCVVDQHQIRNVYSRL